MSTDELRNYATMLTAAVALMVFIANSLGHRRNQRLANLARFLEAQERLFARGGFLSKYLVSVEAGTFVRNHDDPELETKIHLMLLDIERLALLANNDAVPKVTQVYMLGAYAKNLLGMLTKSERENVYWELAVRYLEQLSSETKFYVGLSVEEREKYWR